MILDCVGETEGVKVGSADVDKVYWLESDGTLLCNGIDVSVNEDVTVILPQGDGVVVDVTIAEAVTVEVTELVPDAVPEGNDDAVALKDDFNDPVELVDKVASEVAETDDESTFERETVVVGETIPVSVAIKVTRDDAVADVVDVEVALDVEDVVAEEVAVLVD